CCLPTSGLVEKALIPDHRLVARSSYGPRQQLRDVALQGRYIRRPPIAQHRFEEITDREVEFLTKDLKEKRVVTTQYLIEEFVATLAEHVPDHYRHAIRRIPRARRPIRLGKPSTQPAVEDLAEAVARKLRDAGARLPAG